MDPAEPDENSVWSSIARSYAAFGSPFVPTKEDIAVFERVASQQYQLNNCEGLNATILGVTPGVVGMNWPLESIITAVESSSAVIQALWLGDLPNRRSVLCAKWHDLPGKDGDCDIVVGDGSLNCCRFPDEFMAVIQGIRRLLKPNGVGAIRFYVRPRRQESLDDLFSDLLTEPGMTVDGFKLRLYFAAQETVEQGVAVNAASEILERFGVNTALMKARLGWSDAAIEPFTHWKGSPAVYSFPSFDETFDLLSKSFSSLSVHLPRYALGRSCPIITFRA